MHQQVKLIHEPGGDKALAKRSPAVSNNILARLLLQLPDLRSKIAGKDKRLLPGLHRWRRPAWTILIDQIGLLQRRRCLCGITDGADPFSCNDGLGYLIHRRGKDFGGIRPVGDHIMKGAAAHKMQPCIPDDTNGPIRRRRIHTGKDPVDLTIDTADKPVDGNRHLEKELAHDYKFYPKLAPAPH